MDRATCFDIELKRVMRETAAGLKDSLAAGQPVTTKLIVSCLRDYLRDKNAVAELARRTAAGENAFGQLLRAVIRDEAEQIAQAALASQIAVAA